MFLSKVILKHIVKMYHVLRSGLINQFMSDGKPSKFYFKTSISTYSILCTTAANVPQVPTMKIGICIAIARSEVIFRIRELALTRQQTRLGALYICPRFWTRRLVGLNSQDSLRQTLQRIPV